MTYRLYGIRPGEEQESLVWEDRLWENCAALMELESVRGGREMRIEMEQVTVETKKTETSAAVKKPDSGVLYSVCQRSPGGKLCHTHTEVYETAELAKKAAAKLAQETGFKYVAFRLGDIL